MGVHPRVEYRVRNSTLCTTGPKAESESGDKLDNNQEDELHQVANLVIDAYLRCNESFVPAFEDGVEGVMYLAHSDDENEANEEVKQKRPVLNFWYESSDYRDRGDGKP